MTSVQPRIRLHRSFDQRSHSYLGYVLRVDGAIDGVQRPFRIAIGPAVLAKHMIRVGDELAGQAEPVVDPSSETVELYRVAKLPENRLRRRRPAARSRRRWASWAPQREGSRRPGKLPPHQVEPDAPAGGSSAAWRSLRWLSATRNSARQPAEALAAESRQAELVVHLERSSATCREQPPRERTIDPSRLRD